MEIQQLHQIFLKSSGVSTDSRKIENDFLFLALKGPHFNGNEFATEALKKGAIAVVVDEKPKEKNDKILFVPDVLTTLQDLANFHRNYLGTLIIGLTGSNGKTTTKELIKVVLSKKYIVFATKGNLNNHIGVPLSLLSLEEDTEIAIIEMGANHQKEIELLTNITQPDYGLITNIGKAHLEGFGGEEGVKKGKGELYQHLKENNKTIFINADNHILKELLGDYPSFVSYGSSHDNFVSGKLIAADPFLKISWISIQENIENFIQTNIPGKYNFENILAAVCIGKYMGVDNADIKSAIEEFITSSNRSEIIKTKTSKIIADAYNANPTSMAAAIQNIIDVEKGEKILILGDMLELGTDMISEHKEVIKNCKSNNLDCIFVGPVFKSLNSTFPKAMFFENIEKLKERINEINFYRKTILVKGSRGLKLEAIIEELKNNNY